MSKTPTPSSPARAANVFIVDDHAIVRFGLKQLVESDPSLHVCGEADCIADALHRIDDARPDVMLVDLSMHDENGLDLIRRVHEQWVGMRIVVVSCHDSSRYSQPAFEAGANGYVNKDEAVDHVLHAIHGVLEGKQFLATDSSDPSDWLT